MAIIAVVVLVVECGGEKPRPRQLRRRVVVGATTQNQVSKPIPMPLRAGAIVGDCITKTRGGYIWGCEGDCGGNCGVKPVAA